MKKNRIIILGENSFVASNLINLLKKNNHNFVTISKKKIDLTKKQSTNKLSKILKSNDILVFISAIAPVKNFRMLIQNLEICHNVFTVLKSKKIKYFLYVSSDAVYSDSKTPINEKSKTEVELLSSKMSMSMERELDWAFKLEMSLPRITLRKTPLTFCSR